MAITLTTRLSAGFSGSQAETATSGSFTPSANSRLLIPVFIIGNGDASNYDIAHVSNTGGLSIVPVDNGQSIHTGGGNGGKIRLFEALVGPTPSAMTMTFDVDSDGAETAYTWIGAFDAVGTVNTPRIRSGQVATAVSLGSGGSAESHVSGTLPSPVVSGNRAVLVAGRNNDTAGAAAVPSGWSALFNPTDIYVSGVAFHRADFTGTGPVTVTDLGEQVFASASVLFELEEVSGIPSSPLLTEGGSVLLAETGHPLLT